MTRVRDGADEQLDAAELAGRARALAPLLAEHAAEAEALRRPADAVITALEEARIFDLMVPRCYGGLELDLDAFLEVGLALAEGDASHAWVATFYIEHNWILCQYPEAFQRELFSDRSSVLAPAMIAPTGSARPDGDGLLVDGRWQWATGVMHSSWVMAASLSDETTPQMVALPREQVKVEDTWHVDGMCGTGSNDVVIEGAHVTPERTVSLIELATGSAPGSKLHASPLYRTPMVPILGLAATMPAVGQARAALRGYRERLQRRSVQASDLKHADLPSAQVRLGELELVVQQAELLLRDVVRDIMERRATAEIERRSRWTAAYGTVVHRCREVAQAIAQASGASAHFRTDPLQRALRDLNMLSSHVIFDLDESLRNYGRVQLGMEPSAALL